MISTHVLDGNGKGTRANVTNHGALEVTIATPDIPKEGTPNRIRFYSVKLGSTGADSGIVNLNVDGSVTNQEFYVRSHLDYDIHITELAILIADTSTTHNNFGNIPPLVNGVDLISLEHGESTYLIQAAKTGGQVIAQSGFHYPFGDGLSSWMLSRWTGTEDATVVVFPLNEYIPNGLRIGRGTQDKISVYVRDDLTGLTEFTVRAFGYRLYP